MPINEQLIITIKAIDKATGTLKTVKKTIDTIVPGGKRMVETWDRVGRTWKKTNQTMIDGTRGFKMYYLSMMFGGMMIQRIMTGILKSTMNTFMSITQGQTEAGQAVTGLSAAWQYLQFSVGNAIGSALIPLLDVLIPIIEAFANFAQQHPELVFIGIVGALTAGTAIMAIGQWALFLGGLKMFTVSADFLNLTTYLQGIWDKIVLFSGKVFDVLVDIATHGYDFLVNTVVPFLRGLSLTKILITVGLVWAGWQIGTAIGSYIHPAVGAAVSKLTGGAVILTPPGMSREQAAANIQPSLENLNNALARANVGGGVQTSPFTGGGTMTNNITINTTTTDPKKLADMVSNEISWRISNMTNPTTGR